MAKKESELAAVVPTTPSWSEDHVCEKIDRSVAGIRAKLKHLSQPDILNSELAELIDIKNYLDPRVENTPLQGDALDQPAEES